MQSSWLCEHRALSQEGVLNNSKLAHALPLSQQCVYTALVVLDAVLLQSTASVSLGAP